MRIPTDPQLPQPNTPDSSKNFYLRINELFRKVATQLNMLSEGHIQSVTNATNAAPTAGSYQQGDIVRNTVPTEQGTTGGKYVILGWICVAAGAPGTWVQMRMLTGN